MRKWSYITMPCLHKGGSRAWVARSAFALPLILVLCILAVILSAEP